VVTSKIQEYIFNLTIDESEEVFIEIDQFNDILSKNLSIFVHVINVLNEIIIKDTSLTVIENTIGYFPEDDH
ncbi:hypothetical protein DID76_04565, partial [Candidatus Marinamargulisbacteria bacterium SCGC AG-414-C22]